MKMTHVLAAAMVVSATARPTLASEATDKAAIRRIYATIDAAAKRSDFAKMSSYMAPGYKQRLLNGQTIGKAQAVQMAEAGVKSTQMKFLPTKVTSLRIAGNRAIVEALGGGTMSQADPQGKAHKVVILVKTRDQWAKAGGVWKERSSEQLTQEIQVDGRVVSKQ